jgi:hypothetical protein
MLADVKCSLDTLIEPLAGRGVDEQCGARLTDLPVGNFAREEATKLRCDITPMSLATSDRPC